MIPLSSIVSQLDGKLDAIENQMNRLYDLIASIEDNAADHDRGFTQSEQDRISRYESEIEELEGEQDNILNALDYIREYGE